MIREIKMLRVSGSATISYITTYDKLTKNDSIPIRNLYQQFYALAGSEWIAGVR